jgi:hypothetical protein
MTVANGTLTGSATTSFTFADFGMERPRVAIVLSVEETIKLEFNFRFILEGGDGTLVSVERAVAGYVKTKYPTSALGFQAIAKGFSQAHAREVPPHRSARHIRELAASAGAVVLDDRPTAVLCGVPLVRPCIERVIRIGMPLIMEDVATVWLYVYEGWSPRGECCPRWDESHSKLLLVRRGGSWKVTGVVGYYAT